MTKVRIAGMLVMLSLSGFAQNAPAPQTTTARPQSAPATNANSILAELQRVTVAANADIGRLRIEKWKADSGQRQQMQQVADSLQRNLTTAVPGLISDAQQSPGSVSRTFKLYHDTNVVYEYLNSLAEAAGAFGKKEEYEPLAADATALDNARQKLSSYVEQNAAALENQLRQATAVQVQPQTPPKKVIIDDTPPTSKTRKSTKKKATKPPPTPQ
jgi:hypothetical protein